jgi:predicted transcriptional regulator
MPRNVPVIWEPTRYLSGWLDSFRYPVNSCDGLPPSARAEAILGVMKQLKKYRRFPSLWVTVDSPGIWYITELRLALFGTRQPIAITAVGEEPSYGSFFGSPGVYPVKPGAPVFPVSVFDEFSMPQKERAKLRILRALARMSIAGTKEIASTAGYSHTYMRKLLPELVQEGYVLYHERGMREKRIKVPVWEIRRPGIQYAHQSWNIPDNLRFKGIRVEQKYAGQKHRKMARMWWAWLKEAYGSDYEIWQTWTEPSVANTHPDALTWGSYKGVETLAWLEVESGKKSGERIVKDMMHRYGQAKRMAQEHDMQMIFAILGQQWVLKFLQNKGFFLISWNIALILENWRNVGYLSKPIFGEFNSMMRGNGYPYIKNISRIIKKDPNFLTPKFSLEAIDELLNGGPI